MRGRCWRSRRASTGRARGCATCSAASRPEVRVETGRARRQPARPLVPLDPHRQGCLAAGAGGVRAARAHRRGAAPQARRRARRVPGDRLVQRRQRRACAPRRRAAAAPGRLRLLRIRAEPDGADARPQPPVLQGRSGDAAAEDSRPTASRSSSRRASAPRSCVPRPASAPRSSSSPATFPTTSSGSRTRSGTMRAAGRRSASMTCTRR